MKPFFKTTAMMAAGLSVMTLSACGAKTPEKLILGDWVQSEDVSMTEQGMTITIRESSTSYKADGTSRGGAKIELGGLPENMANYSMSGEATWTMTDGMIKETMTSAKVTPASSDAQAIAVAAQMQAQMSGQGSTTSEIIKLTKDELIVRDTDTDITMSYKRK